MPLFFSPERQDIYKQISRHARYFALSFYAYASAHAISPLRRRLYIARAIMRRHLEKRRLGMFRCKTGHEARRPYDTTGRHASFPSPCAVRIGKRQQRHNNLREIRGMVGVTAVVQYTDSWYGRFYRR